MSTIFDWVEMGMTKLGFKYFDVKIFLSALPLFLLAILFSALISYGFDPGFMSFDSLSQYRQVLGDSPLNDAHPVIMVYLWRTLLGVFDFPGTMLAFHQLFYWLSIALFACISVKSFYARLFLLLLIGFCPPLVITSLHVWKDVGMMVALALASTAILGYIYKPHWGWVILALMSLFYAAAVRINGLIPVFFLLVFLCYLVVEKTSKNWWKALFLTALSVLASLFSYFSLMGVVNSDANRSYGIGTLIVWDIVSVSIAENEDLLPSYLYRAETSDFMHDLARVNSREANYPSYALVSPYPAETYQKQLIKDWVSIIRNYPVSYLKHRAYVFEVLLGVEDRDIYYPYHPGIDENQLGLQFTSMSKEELVGYFNVFDSVSRSIVYRPWLYCVLAVLVVIVCLIRLLKKNGRNHYNYLSAVVGVSGLVSAGSLFFIATAADYRYMTWTIFSAIIAATILFVDILRGCDWFSSDGKTL